MKKANGRWSCDCSYKTNDYWDLVQHRDGCGLKLKDITEWSYAALKNLRQSLS